MSTTFAKTRKIETAAAQSGERLRVLHLINYFEAGGTERQAVELLKRLDPERYDVRLAALRNEGPLYDEIAARFPSVPEFRFTSFYNTTALRQLARLRSFLLRERIDILHAHDFYSGMLGVMAGRLAGSRVIASLRHLSFSDRRAHRWGQIVINRLAHRILVNSNAIRDHLIAGGGVSNEKIVVIRNGLRSIPDQAVKDGSSIRSELLRELGLERGVKLVGMIANLRPVKGHRFFIEAAAQVVMELANAHFVLVGEGELRHEIEQQAARLGIADHVHLLGYRADAARLNAAFDLAVLASLHEGLPNSVMEAMAASAPVVATAVGGVVELIRDGVTGYLAPPADALALAQRITRALTNEVESAAFSARGRQFVTSEFGMEAMVRKVESLYDVLAATL
ncbi:MAG: glycosyltransferase [Chloracidobacterium sp.]|nr:glycosyltransferase [Chloracidobacterium sp.]